MTGRPAAGERLVSTRPRGLATAIVAFAAMIVITGALFALLFVEGLFPMIEANTAAAETAQGADQNALAKQIASGLGIYGVILAATFLIARSVVESRGPG